MILAVYQIPLVKWNPNVRASFFKNPPEGAEHAQKCIESKNEHHFEKPTF